MWSLADLLITANGKHLRTTFSQIQQRCWMTVSSPRKDDGKHSHMFFTIPMGYEIRMECLRRNAIRTLSIALY